jgi:isoquinoline 1-oxidoreductase subunit alpha
MAISFTLNGESVSVDADPEMPLLWAVREKLGLTGTKFGCGIAACGACTMHVDGVATRTCVLPVGDVAGLTVRTIEALAGSAGPSAVQRAWVDLQVPQCGYCQSGMIMAVEALLDAVPEPTDADIDAAVTNICRCGTQNRIRAGVHLAARLRQGV